MDETDLAGRIEALERQAAHAERAIEDLNAVVLDQQKRIDRLTRRLEATDNRLADVEHNQAPAAPEPPPPHY